MLPLLHAWSGCDSTSYVFGKGKKSFLKHARDEQLSTDLANACSGLQECTNELNSDVKEQVLVASRNLLLAVYGKRPEDYGSLNELRANNMYLRQMDLSTLPPTDDAFVFHVLCSIYQTLVWINANQPNPSLPNLFGLGWKYSPCAHDYKFWSGQNSEGLLSM